MKPISRRQAGVRALTILGIILIGTAALTTLDGMANNRLQIERFRQLRAEVAATAVMPSADSMPTLPGEISPLDDLPAAARPIGAAAEEGMPLGTLRATTIDLEVAILAGTGRKTLRLGAGHVEGTSLPGEGGNFAVSAHRDSFFRRLGELRVGDTIVVETLSGSFTYVTESMEIVEPTDIEVLEHRPGRDLTLITCYPFYYVGFAPQRYIVHARVTDAGRGG